MSKDHFSWSTSLTISGVYNDYLTKHNLVVSKQSELEDMIFRGFKKSTVNFAFKVADSWSGLCT